MSPTTPAPLPRLLTVMGSGELAPTMVRVHRAVLERLGPPPVPAVLLDTPFGFQENARELAARAAAYFRDSLRTPLQIASTGVPDPDAPAGTPGATTAFADEELAARVRGARYVFSGPGSPTYALARWARSIVPQLLREKLAEGGAVTFSSAAALTLGRATVPVYEIYKAGEAPHWRDGLDVLALAGLDVAVIPHYNNAEGGTHDTRYCYLGERRLAEMEAVLPEGCFVLGIDEHTACTIDLDAGTARVEGLGVLTVRRAGRAEQFAAGETVPLDALRRAARQGGRAPRTAGEDVAADFVAAAPLASSPLLAIVHTQEAAFAAALARRDAEAAVAAVLALEEQAFDWSTDIPQEDELARARFSLRTMLVELGRCATQGLRDPREVIGPYVEALLAQRTRARELRRFDEADELRDRLEVLGVTLRDGAAGTEWLLRATT